MGSDYSNFLQHKAGTQRVGPVLSWSRMGDSPNATSELIQRLVKSVLSQSQGRHSTGAATDLDAAQLQSLCQYSMRILGSRLEPTVVHDDFALEEIVKKKLVQESGPTAALAFSELAQRLGNISSGLNNKWAILYLLYSLSGSRSRQAPQSFDSVVSSMGGLGLRSFPAMATSTAQGATKSKALSRKEQEAVLQEQENSSLINMLPLSDQSSQAIKAKQAPASTRQGWSLELSEAELVRELMFVLQVRPAVNTPGAIQKTCCASPSLSTSVALLAGLGRQGDPLRQPQGCVCCRQHLSAASSSPFTGDASV